jgi:hypothetical protein
MWVGYAFKQEVLEFGLLLVKLEIHNMASQEKLTALTDLLKEVLSEGQEINTAEFPYIVIKGDIDGKGILWNGQGNNKQFIFNSKPDRFFVSENIDLAKGKQLSINNIKVVDEKELGPTITKSSLREVGHLKGLIVDGGLSVNQYLVYDSITDRLGLGTDQPKAAVNIIDQNVDIIIGASSINTAMIGTFNYTDLDIGTDNTPRISIKAGGNVVIGNASTGDTKVSIIGSLAINVSSADPRSSLHVNGALKFNDKLHLSGNEPPVSGGFNEGDVVWNNYPTPGKFVGWVCTKTGSPGIWNGFGRIE